MQTPRHRKEARIATKLPHLASVPFQSSPSAGALKLSPGPTRWAMRQDEKREATDVDDPTTSMIQPPHKKEEFVEFLFDSSGSKPTCWCQGGS